jgi:hypothetical protein
MKADDPQLKDFTALVSDPAISPKDRAQKLLDLYTSNVKAAAEANGKAWTDLTTKWVDEIKADKEIGGANLEKTQQTIAKALGQYGDPGLNEALAMTGAGNNPAIIRTLFKMAKALNEGGTPPSGNPPAGGPKDIASIMYPNHAKG